MNLFKKSLLGGGVLISVPLMAITTLSCSDNPEIQEEEIKLHHLIYLLQLMEPLQH